MLIIDRIEENTAIAEQEDGGFLHIPIGQINGPCREGDVLFFSGGLYHVDRDATTKSAARIRKKLDHLFKRNS